MALLIILKGLRISCGNKGPNLEKQVAKPDYKTVINPFTPVQ